MPKFIDRTGETRMMNFGLKATIIRYGGSHDIDVQFEQGQIACHRRYSEFKRGYIRSPLIIEHIDDYAKVTNPNCHPCVSFLVDFEDLEIVKCSRWGTAAAGYITADGIGLLHRLIMNAKPGEQVDHINGDKSDNRRSNLRICNRYENARNRGALAHNTTGLKGVFKRSIYGKYRSSICVNGKQIHLGLFNTPEEAARAYNEAALKYHGDFAWLNDV